jgi:hypothetical protein
VAGGSAPVADGQVEGAALADDHDQLAGAGDGGVEEGAAEQRGVAHQERDHHRWELGALGLVDRDGVGVGQGVETAKRVVDLAAVVELDQQLLFGWVDRQDRAEVAVEDFQVVVVLELQHPVAGAVGSPRGAGLGCAFAGRIEALLEQQVEIGDAGFAAVHWGEDLGLAGTVAVAGWEALGDQLGDQPGGAGRVVGR